MSAASHQDAGSDTSTANRRSAGRPGHRSRHHVRHSVVVSNSRSRPCRKRTRRTVMQLHHQGAENGGRTQIALSIASSHRIGAYRIRIWIIPRRFGISGLWHVRCLKFWRCSEGALSTFRYDASFSTGALGARKWASKAVKGYKASTEFELVTHQQVTR